MIHWTEQNVIDAVEKAMSPPKNGRRMATGLNTQALERLMEQAKSKAPGLAERPPKPSQLSRGVKP